MCAPAHTAKRGTVGIELTQIELENRSVWDNTASSDVDDKQ